MHSLLLGSLRAIQSEVSVRIIPRGVPSNWLGTYPIDKNETDAANYFSAKNYVFNDLLYS